MLNLEEFKISKKKKVDSDFNFSKKVSNIFRLRSDFIAKRVSQGRKLDLGLINICP